MPFIKNMLPWVEVTQPSGVGPETIPSFHYGKMAKIEPQYAYCLK